MPRKFLVVAGSVVRGADTHHNRLTQKPSRAELTSGRAASLLLPAAEAEQAAEEAAAAKAAAEAIEARKAARRSRRGGTPT